VILSGWGRYPRVECRTAWAGFAEDTRRIVTREPSLIARGRGRAYGDAALNPDMTLLTERRDRVLAFDPITGRVTCEAGMTLGDLVATFLPRGWFPPVTPGTKFVTVGGAIAVDAHGKNHHVTGTFGRHVEALDLMLSDGRIVTCSSAENAALFDATRGGMGLTGIILSATFRLVPVETPWIRQETLRLANLEETMAAFEASAGWTHSVAWIDCLSGGDALGRSLLYRGEHARRDELPAALGSPRSRRPLTVPPVFPGWALNRLSVSAFNAAYYRLGRPGVAFVDCDTFFYPLDSLDRWNRIYGPAGFTQYQCVLPKSAGAEGTRRLLTMIARAGSGSFLAVLKLFGDFPGGPLSFPMEGYTLALDFPMRSGTLSLLRELDAVVADHGGRIYLAKDVRATPEVIERGYPRLDRFHEIRRDATRFQSLLSRRLKL